MRRQSAKNRIKALSASSKTLVKPDIVTTGLPENYEIKITAESL